MNAFFMFVILLFDCFFDILYFITYFEKSQDIFGKTLYKTE